MILVDRFLYRNGLEVRAAVAETVKMVLAVEADRWGVAEIEAWYHKHAAPSCCKIDNQLLPSSRLGRRAGRARARPARHPRPLAHVRY